MLEFSHPCLFLIIWVPFVLRRILKPYKEKQASVRVPFFHTLVHFTGSSPAKGAVVHRKMPFQKIALTFSWCLMVTAMAGPTWVGEPIVREKSARDIMVAVDISGSMGTEDFKTRQGGVISRLDGVKGVLNQFARKRRHDRLGLMIFGTSPYLQAPFTADQKTWLSLLAETEVGMAGPKTNFGDAIGLSIRLFEESETQNRVLVVLTDGNDTGSKVPPVEAAKIAQAKEVRIYTVSVGDPEATGQEKADIETLARIADITGGAFFIAHDGEKLSAAHDRILALEPEEYETIVFSPKRSLHHYLLGAIILLYNGLFGTLFFMSKIKRPRGIHGEF